MRVTRPVVVFVVVSSFLVSTLVAQTAATSTQAASVLQNAFAALVGKSTVSDVTLTGMVERIAGSDDESGNATYKALPGSNRLDMAFSSGTRTEIRTTGNSGPSGSWIGVDGVSHPVARHNLMTGVDLVPSFLLNSLSNTSQYSLTYVGPETLNDVSVTHMFAAENTSSLPDDQVALVTHLSRIDLYFDASTNLPSKIAFNQHPDNNFQIDIPSEIRYSDYRIVDGAQIPFHIQKYINNSLILDIQFQSAVLNSGISSSTFQVQ